VDRRVKPRTQPLVCIDDPRPYRGAGTARFRQIDSVACSRSAVIAAPGLVGVHPLVGQLPRRASGERVLGNDSESVGGGDHERATSFAQRGRGVRGQCVIAGIPSREQRAEFVAAEAIRAAVALDGPAQRGSQSRQQRVPGGVPEGVVVSLEPVQIKEHKRRGMPGVGVHNRVVEVLHQPPPVTQPAEAVGNRVVSAATQHPNVLEVRP
jgi:hypothetical protein